jgi:hypothetical protein
LRREWGLALTLEERQNFQYIKYVDITTACMSSLIQMTSRPNMLLMAYVYGQA